MKRSHASRLRATVLLAAAALFALPAVAQAEHRDRDRHRHERHAHRAPVYHHGTWCAHRSADRGFFRHYRKAHRAHVQPYACRPCSRRFGSWHAFRRHMHHHHHVAPWRLPRLLVRHGSFWVFVG